MSTEPSDRSPGKNFPRDESLLSFLLEHIPDRIYFKDRESRFLRISRAMAEFFGLKDPEDAVGRTDFDFFTREHAQPAFDDEQAIMRTGEPIVGKVEKETRPGLRAGWAMTTKMPLRDATGAIVGTCGISKDFTAQKELEQSLEHSNALLAAKQVELQTTLDELRATHEKLKAAQAQLIEAEKIQSLGRLACGVAHEVRNPLNILGMAVEFLGRQPAVTADPASGVILASMKEAVTRADAVVTELVEASGDSEIVCELTGIAPILHEAVAGHAAAAGRKNVAVSLDVPDDLPLLNIDRDKIQEALAAILDNALDASSDGGQITLRARQIRLEDAELNAGSRSAKKLRAGDRLLRIEIEDTGSGIPREILGSIFDPFFTTKSTGVGLGLGLTVCRKTIELHGGRIEIESEPGRGTRVVIDLPAGE